MKYYGLNELREMFLSYYEKENGHLRLPSFSLIPHNDKSLLLINSGMAPLKPYFTGEETPPRRRVTTCQKCIRTPDIENVGKTARHGTFFEMLGNFSFGDYFKEEAITWAWTFLTEKVGIPKDILYVTIYEDDEEAFDIWHNKIGVEKCHITRHGKEDNFWEIGTGPCGPDSEIFVDRGEKYGCGKPTCGVDCDCDRFVEVWNLVFTQFDKDDEGNYSRLAHPNIDTGMGLERLAVICQDVDNLFEVDTIRYVLDYICEKAGIVYGKDENKDISARVITDHIRSSVFMLSDGVIPSNEGRGYVLRRLFRRAVRHGKLLNINGMFMAEIAEKVIETSRAAYPALSENREMIIKMINVEEARFNETINQGNDLINKLIEDTKAENKTILNGNDVFRLYDTFGFPIELTEEIAEEKGMTIDKVAFTEAMNRQKKMSKEARLSQSIEGWKDELTQIVSGMDATVFKGYTEFEIEAEVKCIVLNGKKTDSASAGDNCIVIADQTPFYAQSGGEIGDTGSMLSDNLTAEVTDTIKSGDKFAHFVTVNDGKIHTGDHVKLSVDMNRRLDISRNHTATHLLHKALKIVLGEHVNQAGSEVTEEKLRFDFSHFEKMTNEQIQEVEDIVNEEILSSIPVEWHYDDIDNAKKLGATALFGEKYGKEVRVVTIGDFSMELCGGCHLSNTAQAGIFKIISETGVSAGVRRIEALTGHAAVKYVNDMKKELEDTAAAAKTTVPQLKDRVSELVKANSALEKEVASLQSKLNASKINDVLSNGFNINGVDCIVSYVKDASMDVLRDLADKARDKNDSCLVFLISTFEGKGFMLSAATKSAVANGFNCGNIIKQVAQSIGSGGGGSEGDPGSGPQGKAPHCG